MSSVPFISCVTLFTNRVRGAKHIWQLLLVVGLSCYCSDNLLAMESPTFILKNNHWEQLVVPADTSNTSIRALFADDADLPADQYGVSWAIYPYDGVSNSYTTIGLDDTLPNGTGFWMVQNTGKDVTLEIPDNIPPIPTEGSIGCALSACSSIAIPAATDRAVFSMLGSGLTSTVLASELRVRTEQQGSLCLNGCDLESAAGNDYISASLLRWDNDSQNFVDLAEVGTISPWHAFWLNAQPNAANANASLLFPTDTDTHQLEFYGMEWTSDPLPGDFETAIELGVDTIMFDFYGSDPNLWIAELDNAQELGVKVVANYWSGESAWTRTDSGWYIRPDSRNFLNTVADHPALLAVYLLHEPYYNGGDEITTAEQRDLYNQIKAIADVPLYSAFSWSAFEQEKFEAGVCDYCDTWFYPSEFDNPYNEAELNRKLERLLNHFNVATVNSPETKLVWILQAFESSIAGKEMPTYDEMIALASTAIQYQASSGQQVDAVFWYTWRHGSEYQKVLGDYPELQQAVKEVHRDYVQ